MAASSDGKLVHKEEIYSLKEFTECFDLPKWVSVVGGFDAIHVDESSRNKIKKGDILLFHTLAVETVALKFNDAETGARRIVQVSPDSQVGFQVCVPQGLSLSKDKNQPIVYETVADLLKVCPTYFQVNVEYDDPYLPAIFKPGEKFRFVRQIRNVTDRRIYLQCEDAAGNILELPYDCKGDFTVVEDDRAYTLRELINIGQVPRRLKLSRDRRKLSLVSETPAEDTAAAYGNLAHSSGTDVLQRVMGLPLTYNGILTLQRPEPFLIVSPSTNLDDVHWKLPLDRDIYVKQYSPNEYEVPGNSPVKRMYKLNELLEAFADKLPVLATLIHYKDLPNEFRGHLQNGIDVIIHKIDKEDKLLATSKGMCFCISKRMEGKFRDTLKQFQSLQELKEYGDEVKVKIMQDVASDFPEPYSLRAGDVLRIRSFEIKEKKVKRGSKTFGPFPCIKCELLRENGKYQKMYLPDDLEVYMYEIPNKDKAYGFSAADVFRLRTELPRLVDYLPDYASLWTCLPVSSEIELTHYISEALALVSTLPKTSTGENSCLDSKLETCLAIPARHNAVFTVKQQLGFPSGYFTFPDTEEFVSVAVEKLSRRNYDKLVTHHDSAYEDYEFTTQNTEVAPANQTIDTVLPTRLKRSKRKTLGVNKRLSKSLGQLFKKKPPSPTTPTGNEVQELSDDEQYISSEVSMAVTNRTYLTYENQNGHGADENIYESVEELRNKGKT